MNKQWVVISEEQLQRHAALLAPYLNSGMVLLLQGTLGAGKTSFTKGLAKGLQIEQMVKSPTYTLVREYTKGRLPLYHMDLYRLEDSGGGGDFGLDDYLNGTGICVIEWPQFGGADIPDTCLRITLSLVDNRPTQRHLCVAAVGAAYEQLVQQWWTAIKEDLDATYETPPTHPKGAS